MQRYETKLGHFKSKSEFEKKMHQSLLPLREELARMQQTISYLQMHVNRHENDIDQFNHQILGK